MLAMNKACGFGKSLLSIETKVSFPVASAHPKYEEYWTFLNMV